MKKILYSLNPDKYPDIVIDFIEVNAENSRNFAKIEIIEARKISPVTAIQVQKEVKVVTRPRVEVDGRLYFIDETTNTAHKGDWIITNPDGEQYVLSDDRFQTKYQSDNNGRYLPIEDVKQFRQITHSVCFQSQKGDWRFVTAGSYLCISTGSGNEYGITNSAFDQTYEIETPVME